LRRLRSLEKKGMCAPRSTRQGVTKATVLERVAITGAGIVPTSAPASGSKKPGTKKAAIVLGGLSGGGRGDDGPAKDRAEVKGESASGLPARPGAVAAGGDWTHQLLIIVEILLLLACAAWVWRAVWRVL
jgi:hypothetical protein